ncbi:Na+/H+ antiporter subunit E [Roseomonas sp. NAR14]|uniref:Na+/H+ antiporter subunit E n=1 Tax=Roseomonas acroporae TaxID=2937791 RepID=A0A9X1YHF7_9PROT|nr:Na+/H+ antiporter subunit E [Roseomonas acroporae]MCK8786241.1 Na+/H+ antiporter subunit E [Roseomonas acroporae]
MTTSPTHVPSRRASVALIGRVPPLLVAWVAMAGAAPDSLLVGLPAVLAAALCSLRLLPPSRPGLRPLALIGYAPRLLAQSLLGGIDVARRALAPRPVLRPGFVAAPLALPAGNARAAFCAAASLVPGTLPAGDTADGGVLLHALDLDQPVLDAWARDAAAFRRLLAPAPLPSAATGP